LLLQETSRQTSRETPVKRVVGLLEEMQKTLQKEMDEDEGLYNKLKCWCNNNAQDKKNGIEESKAKIAELGSSIEGLTAKKSELATQIKELNEEVAANKNALAEAQAIREKELQEFHGQELDNVQAIENLKAALTVLSKHHSSAFPQIPALSLLGLSSKTKSWKDESSRVTHSLDDFMRRNDIFEDADSGEASVPQRVFRHDGRRPVAGWSSDELRVVRGAMKSAAALVQARHGYYPSYTSQSGEIFGILQQLLEELQGDHADAQKLETQRSSAFAELRDAKEAEIEKGEAMAEKKEDEHATTTNELAEAKEDLVEEEKTLEEAQTFVANLEKTCGEADANFEKRTQVRTEEIKAVAETIAILQENDARDTLARTYSFVQLSASARSAGKLSSVRGRRARGQAAASLRRAAIVSRDPKLAMLATHVELDAFAKVKEAIDAMIGTLKVQQEDEVKKSDFCKAEFHETEMTTAKTEDRSADLQAKEAELESSIKSLEEAVAAAHAQISELQVNLQRANEDRQAENHAFQTTITDQMATVAVLKKASERLAKFYEKEDEEALLQVRSRRQTPPVAQAEYAPNKGASGVMQMIEKLIQEAKDMIADSRKSESESQAAYEQTVADTNGSVSALQKEVVTKTKAKAKATKEKQQTGQDIIDTMKELEGLAKYTGDLHAECDFVLKNFEVRQKGRAEEIESLQGAKQVLSGASLE
jgi:myosin protein heavy chain